MKDEANNSGYLNRNRELSDTQFWKDSKIQDITVWRVRTMGKQIIHREFWWENFLENVNFEPNDCASDTQL